MHIGKLQKQVVEPWLSPQRVAATEAAIVRTVLDHSLEKQKSVHTSRRKRTVTLLKKLLYRRTYGTWRITLQQSTR